MLSAARKDSDMPKAPMCPYPARSAFAVLGQSDENRQYVEIID
jgi:hypothetical protein